MCEIGDQEPRLFRGKTPDRELLEFYRVFPETYRDGDDPDRVFKVKTAVRMNASFPYISPAVSLPVLPKRRVVDAGYYDNYGVNLALTWAYHNRDWIRETSGLALVQIRAYMSEAIRKQLWVGPRDEPSGPTNAFFRRLNTGIQALTSPPEGALGRPELEHVLPQRRAGPHPRQLL